MVDLQALSINRDDHNNGSFRRKKELVSPNCIDTMLFNLERKIDTQF